MDRAERDSMLADLVQIGDREYRSTLIVRTFHSMSSLGELRERIDLTPQQSFLHGTFTIELNGQRHRELLETPAHMEFRLKTEWRKQEADGPSL